ncbi:hypothetical protein MSAN_01094000 [Mycena sanguinolenta]|uniref:Ricin B lectin domain-containing protein n=1 Tax=Mycena sanguinolenta TaxID=230812 RepID=A0A8H6YSE6_9AGAR|nr:hypothetical protein MSAN_01094000 [Mycena sanguinolenta]
MTPRPQGVQSNLLVKMFSQVLVLVLYASALVSGAPSSTQKSLSCALNMQTPPLEEGHYKIYNSAAGSSRLAAFNVGTPVLLAPGNVPPESIVWKVTPVPGQQSQYYITNPDIEAGIFGDESIITVMGTGNPWTIRSDGGSGYLIGDEGYSGDLSWVWHASHEDSRGARTVRTRPVSGVAEQSWTFLPSKYYG